MDTYIYVQASDGTPLMPTKRFNHVQKLLRRGRALIKSQRERTYYMEDPVTGKLKAVAKNRKPRFEQPGSALSGLGLTRQEISRLTVKKSTRYYNAADRLMPGAEFFYDGERHIMTGQLTRGKYFRTADQGARNYPAANCRIRKENCGLVYIS